MLGRRIRQLRMESDMTQSELAAKIGVSIRSIAYYEQGVKHPDYDLLALMADLFNVSVDYMLGRTSNKNEIFTLPDDCLLLLRAYQNSQVDVRKILEYVEFLKAQQKKS